MDLRNGNLASGDHGQRRIEDAGRWTVPAEMASVEKLKGTRRLNLRRGDSQLDGGHRGHGGAASRRHWPRERRCSGEHVSDMPSALAEGEDDQPVGWPRWAILGQKVSMSFLFYFFNFCFIFFRGKNVQ